MTSPALLLLDRDGTINYDNEGYIGDPDKWQPIPGSLEAIATANRANINVAVISNQSGLGRGYFTEAQLSAVHDKMHAALAAVGGRIDGMFICPHHPNENCNCRKPKTTLLQQASQQFAVPAEHCVMIGDSSCDMLAAENFGCDGHLVLTGYGHRTWGELSHLQSHHIHNDLSAAIDYLLRK